MLHVSLVRNRYQLSTEHAIYSFDDLYHNFERAFRQIELPPNDSSLLLLGLGLGSVPYMLEKQYNKKYRTTAVELDESVIQLAAGFTFPRLLQKIEVVHADAEIFVQTDTRKYDFIIVDLFLDDIVPPFFNTKEGLVRLKELLKKNGMILINRLYRTEKDKSGTNAFFDQSFKEVFPKGRYLDVGGNWILINF